MDSYEKVLEKMEQAYEEQAGVVPDKYSDTGIKLRVLAGEIYSIGTEVEWLKKQMFPTTATGTALEKHAAERGLERRAAEKSKGEVTFMLEYVQNEGVVIPKGTVVSTTDEVPLRFLTTETSTIEVGTTYVNIPVEAEFGGSRYNVGYRDISVLVTSVPLVYSVVNQSAFTGGADAESDEELRNRLYYSYQNNNNGTNIAFYKGLAESVQGIYSAGIIPRNRGTGTVDIYISKYGTEADSELVSQVQGIMNKAREVNVSVIVYTARATAVDIYVNVEVKDGYTFEDVRQRCIAELKEYVTSLGVGASLYLSQAAERIYHIPGIKRFVFDYDYCDDVVFNNTRFPVPGDIEVGLL